MPIHDWYSHLLSPHELKRFIDEERNGKTNKSVWIGMVEPEAARRIKAVSGAAVSKIMLESGAVRHSYNKAHHNLEDNDLSYAVEVINNAATIIEVSSQKHRDSDVLTFKGNINGEIYFLEAVRPKHDGWLSLITCYRPRKAGQGSNAVETTPRS